MAKRYVLNDVVSVVVLGNCLLVIDVEDEGGTSSIDINWGGFAFAASQSLADFGSSVKIVSIIGDDEQGELILKQLSQKRLIFPIYTVTITSAPPVRSDIMGNYYFKKAFPRMIMKKC